MRRVALVMRHATPRRVLWWAAFGLGVCLSLLMAFRSQVGRDQRLMLDLGWSLLVRGEWLPYGMPTSAGGRSPGGLLAIVVALPLAVWRDFRAPAMLTLALHAGAFLLFVRTVRPALTGAGHWLLLPLLWFNPWRIYFSAHVWNANFMFVFAVLHLATARRMRARRELWTTCAHVLIIGLAIQIHTSAATLAILSLVLRWRRMIRVHWGGVAVAVAAILATLWPWAIAILAQPSLAPGGEGFPLRGLILVLPMLRGVLYWVRLPSLSVPNRIVDFDFSGAFGGGANAVLVPLGVGVALLAHLTVVPSIWANGRSIWRQWRIWRALGWDRPPPERPRAWLHAYVALTFGAAVLSFAISPTSVMFWQEFVVLPAAVLVLLLPTECLFRTAHRRFAGGAVAIWCVLLGILLAFQVVAAPAYRCGGWKPDVRDAASVDLGVPDTCGEGTPE